MRCLGFISTAFVFLGLLVIFVISGLVAYETFCGAPLFDYRLLTGRVVCEDKKEPAAAEKEIKKEEVEEKEKAPIKDEDSAAFSFGVQEMTVASSWKDRGDKTVVMRLRAAGLKPRRAPFFLSKCLQIPETASNGRYMVEYRMPSDEEEMLWFAEKVAETDLVTHWVVAGDCPAFPKIGGELLLFYPDKEKELVWENPAQQINQQRKLPGVQLTLRQYRKQKRQEGAAGAADTVPIRLRFDYFLSAETDRRWRENFRKLASAGLRHKDKFVAGICGATFKRRHGRDVVSGWMEFTVDNPPAADAQLVIKVASELSSETVGFALPATSLPVLPLKVKPNARWEIPHITADVLGAPLEITNLTVQKTVTAGGKDTPAECRVDMSLETNPGTNILNIAANAAVSSSMHSENGKTETANIVKTGDSNRGREHRFADMYCKWPMTAGGKAKSLEFDIVLPEATVAETWKTIEVPLVWKGDELAVPQEKDGVKLIRALRRGRGSWNQIHWTLAPESIPAEERSISAPWVRSEVLPQGMARRQFTACRNHQQLEFQTEFHMDAGAGSKPDKLRILLVERRKKVSESRKITVPLPILNNYRRRNLF